jgi:hypothetical protein
MTKYYAEGHPFRKSRERSRPSRMNQITHRHHTLDPAEGPDLEEMSNDSPADLDDDEPISGSDAVADGEDTEFD